MFIVVLPRTVMHWPKEHKRGQGGDGVVVWVWAGGGW